MELPTLQFLGLGALEVIHVEAREVLRNRGPDCWRIRHDARSRRGSTSWWPWRRRPLAAAGIGVVAVAIGVAAAIGVVVDGAVARDPASSWALARVGVGAA